MKRKRSIPQHTPVRSVDGYNVGWFYLDVWKANFHLVWPWRGRELTPEDLSRYIKRTFGVTYEKSEPFNGRCIEIIGHESRCCVIALRQEWRGSPLCYSTLAHEAFHAADITLDNRNARFVQGGENEHYAYLLDTITLRCGEMLETSRKRSKKR